MHHSQSPAPIPPTGPIAPGPQAYIPPNPDGTAFIIPDVAQKVPPEIAQYFQRDAEGNILFYRTPPIDVNKPVANIPGRNGQIVGHSLAYLAKKKELDENRKRKEKELEGRQEESKRKKSELDEQLKKEAQKAVFSALELWVKQLEN
jgi:chromatin structure-remodeling complex subunit RSC1/2